VDSLVAGTRSFSGSHSYVTSGTYNVTITVTDRDNGVGTKGASLVVTPRNTAPSGLSLSSNVTGLSATVSGSFVDPDPLDTHVLTMLWGDGTTSTSTLVAGATMFSETHTYPAAGTFTVTATVTDPAAAAATATASVVTTAPSAKASDVLDQMSALVSSFGLAPNTESWLLRKIDSLRASLTSGGNAQLCADLKVLGHISAFAGRTLTNDQAAALDALGKNLETSAGCTGTVIAAPKLQRARTVPTTVTPTPTREKEETDTDEDKAKTEKSDKTEKSHRSVKADKPENSGGENGSRKGDRDSG
jgi:PKD repeat protein